MSTAQLCIVAMVITVLAAVAVAAAFVELLCDDVNALLDLDDDLQGRA